MKSVEEQIALIERGAVDFHSREDLVKKLTRSLETNKPLTIKEIGRASCRERV